MKVIEAIERAKSLGCAENTSNDILRDSIVRLEKQIAKKAEIVGDRAVSDAPADYRNTPVPEELIIEDESVLLACGGGVAEGYDDMYDAYLKREASRVCEAWENYGNYDTVFNIRYRELCQEIIRNREPKRFEFSC